MPRAPHRRALLEGSFSAKRDVLFSSISRVLLIPFRSVKSIRFMSVTGFNSPFSACHTNASEPSSVMGKRAVGAMRSNDAAIRSANLRRSRSCFIGKIITSADGRDRNIHRFLVKLVGAKLCVLICKASDDGYSRFVSWSA